MIIFIVGYFLILVAPAYTIQITIGAFLLACVDVYNSHKKGAKFFIEEIDKLTDDEIAGIPTVCKVFTILGCIAGVLCAYLVSIGSSFIGMGFGFFALRMLLTERDIRLYLSSNTTK